MKRVRLRRGRSRSGSESQTDSPQDGLRFPWGREGSEDRRGGDERDPHRVYVRSPDGRRPPPGRPVRTHCSGRPQVWMHQSSVGPSAHAVSGRVRGQVLRHASAVLPKDGPGAFLQSLIPEGGGAGRGSRPFGSRSVFGLPNAEVASWIAEEDR